MNWLKSLSIRFKILLIAAIAILGFSASLIFNYSVTQNNVVRLENVRDVYFPTLEYLDTNLNRLEKIKETLNTAVSTEEIELVDDTDEMAAATRNAYTEISNLDVEATDKIANLKRLFNDYYTHAVKLTRGMTEGGLPQAELEKSIGNMNASMAKYESTLKTIRAANYERFSASIQAANDDSKMALQAGLIISLLVITVVGLTGYVVSTAISKNIRSVVVSLQDMSHGDGDLTVRLQASSKDEIGQLVDSFNTFVGKLQTMIGEITGSITQLASASSNLSTVSSESNDSVVKQQVETDQVATAINEMTATAQEVARNASQTSDAANKASSETSKGHQIVSETIESINELASEVDSAATTIRKLHSGTENIGGVLEAIRGILEQTNLLALNAAIEAARAGEHGRGFSVVADEVRTLANRTRESTLEIQGMIEDLQTGATHAVAVMEQGQRKAQGSVENAVKAGESLKLITNAVTTIRDMNTQIASAAEEQTTVAQEIDRNITNISQLSIQTSDGTRQTASSSEQMAQLAVQLQNLVGQFKV